MTTDIVQASFDYGMLDTETRIVVQQRTGEIKTLVRKSAQDIIDIGAKLLEVKARLGHGQFAGWLRSEFEWSQDTAGRFMQVAQRFGQIPQIAEFAPSALYLLASPSTPDAAVDEALTRAAAGETISRATAQEIVQEHKPPAGEQPSVGRTVVANAGQQEWAPIWKLEGEVRETHGVFYREENEIRSAPSDMRACARIGDGGFWSQVVARLGLLAYRKSDLRQAINNVAAQMEAQANGTNFSAGDPHSHKVQPATAPPYMKFVCLSCGCIYAKGSCDECHSFTYQVATSPEEAERLSASVKAAKAAASAERQAAEPVPVAEVIDTELFGAAGRAITTDLKPGMMRRPFEWNGAYWVSVGGIYGGDSTVEYDQQHCVRVHPDGEPIAPGVRINRYRAEAFAPGTELRHGANVWRIGEQWLVVKRRRTQPAPAAQPAAWVGVNAHTWEGYADWDDVDQAEYDALAPTWRLPRNEFNDLAEAKQITRWRVAARLASERQDSLSWSLQDIARRLRLRAQIADRDDAWRQAAAVEAERQAESDAVPITNQIIFVKNKLRQWLGKRYENYTKDDAAYSSYQMLDNWKRGAWQADLENFTETLSSVAGWTQAALDQAIAEMHEYFTPRAVVTVHPEVESAAAAVTITQESKPVETATDDQVDESHNLASKRKARLISVKRQLTGALDILPEFGDLTGRHTASLLAGRELVNMVEIIDGELDALQRIEVAE